MIKKRGERGFEIETATIRIDQDPSSRWSWGLNITSSRASGTRVRPVSRETQYPQRPLWCELKPLFCIIVTADASCFPSPVDAALQLTTPARRDGRNQVQTYGLSYRASPDRNTPLTQTTMIHVAPQGFVGQSPVPHEGPSSPLLGSDGDRAPPPSTAGSSRASTTESMPSHQSYCTTSAAWSLVSSPVSWRLTTS